MFPFLRPIIFSFLIYLRVVMYYKCGSMSNVIIPLLMSFMISSSIEFSVNSKCTIGDAFCMIS